MNPLTRALQEQHPGAARVHAQLLALRAVPDPPRPLPTVSRGLPLPANTPPILILYGHPASGKSTIAEYLQTVYRGVHQVSFSSHLIACANAHLARHQQPARLRPEDRYQPAVRRALQDLGGLLQDHQPDLYATWALQAQRRMRARGARLTVIAGARIPLRPDGTLNRASHDQLRAHGAHSWRVDRPDSTYHAPHPVEAGIDQLAAHEHEHHLRNRDQLPDLWWQVELALHARPGRPSRPRTADAYRARP